MGPFLENIGNDYRTVTGAFWPQTPLQGGFVVTSTTGRTKERWKDARSDIVCRRLYSHTPCCSESTEEARVYTYSMAASVSVKAAKQFLDERKVDYSDCFERNELLQRFASVKINVDKAIIEKAKMKANGAFKRQSHAASVRLYTEALALTCKLHASDEEGATARMALLLANRSMAYLQLALPRQALEDAQLCVHLDAKFMKGHARLAAACLAMGLHEPAATHYARARDLATSEQDRLHMQAQIDSARQASEARASAEGSRVQHGALTQPDDEFVAQPDCPLLRLLTDDMLAALLCELDSAADLGATASVCRALRVAAAAHWSGGGWHSLCVRHWSEMARSVEGREAIRQEECGAAARAIVGTSSMQASHAEEAEGDGHMSFLDRRFVLGVDWRTLFRERAELSQRWDSGRAHFSILGEHRGPPPYHSHPSPVYGLRMRGDFLLSSSEDATLGVWDMATRRNRPIMVCDGHDHGVLGLWFDADGRRCVSGGFDGTLRVWDLSRAEDAALDALRLECGGGAGGGAAGAGGTPPKATCMRCCVGHSAPVVSIECSERHIYSSSFDGCVRLWDWAGQQVRTVPAHEGHCSGLDLMEGGARFLSGGDDGMVRLWDAETGQMQLVVGAGRGGAVWSIRHCPMRGHLLSAATNGTLVQTDLRSGRMVCQQVSAHDDAVAGIQLDEQKVVTSGFDSAVKIWDLRMGLAQRARLDAPHGTRCTRLAYDENRIVTGSLCGAIVVWDFQ